MKAGKKTISLLLMLTLAAALLPWGGMTARAETVTDSGQCGDSAEYTRIHNDDGSYTLKITGSGAITDGFFASNNVL